MKFKEFVDTVNRLYYTIPRADEKAVVIVTNDGGVGGRSCTNVKSVLCGFDWEANRINIEVEDIIHKGKRTKDIVEQPEFKGKSPCDNCSVEPPAMKFVCSKCEWSEEENANM